ncbi:uncharacterized protein LOC113315621 [Papaver somniferum]|uniref:uncharacterized protein LOC113315621 n=1 Tax=Papaver somniferum TaxID=3469 RepID=UPI000E6F75F0|nr:uncharacterized protein LOC113315621 [Papaver somniferum]
MAKFFQAKFQNKNGEWISYYKKSSIWQGIKWLMADVQEGTRCLVGNGETISVWKDKWMQDKSLQKKFPNMKVADLILEGEWVIPSEMMEMIEINEIPVIPGGEDKRIWSYTISGEFTVASVVEAIREKFPKLQWKTQVWHPYVHPNVSSNIRKLARSICSTDKNLKKRKVQLAYRCCFCKKEEENKEHILWFCNFSEIIWQWLGNMFNFINPSSFEEMLKMAKNKSPAIKEIWRVASFITTRELWFTRNKCIYEEEILSLELIKKKILKFTKECEVRMKAPMWNCYYDLQVLKVFELECRKVKGTRVKEVLFQLPPPNEILMCCDGASKRNPGISGYGFIGRSSSGEYLIAVSGGLGVSTNFYTEILAVLNAGELAVSKGHKEIWFRTDSSASILAFQGKKIPWFAIKRWEKICANLTSWCFIDSYREVNFSTDGLAKK